MELLEADVSLENDQYNFGQEGRNTCTVCFGDPGFPLLCNVGDPGDHRFCANCAYSIYKQPGRDLLCPVCRLPFNFQDYFVVRELHLMHLFSDESISDYFHKMQLGKTVYSSLDEICWEDFFWLGEEDQKSVISKIYWGNDLLFDKLNDYPSNNSKDKRVKENLLEMFGNLWSPELDTKEKNQQLIEVMTNGIYVKSLQNELPETFAHRCHIFLRAFFPLHAEFNGHIVDRMQWIKGPFPEYNILQHMEYKDLNIATRPAAGPLGTQESDSTFRNDVNNTNLNLHLISLVVTLKNALQDLFVGFATRFYFLSLCCVSVGLGFRQAINLVLIQSGFVAIALIFGFLCCKYLVSGIEQRICLVNFVRNTFFLLTIVFDIALFGFGQVMTVMLIQVGLTAIALLGIFLYCKCSKDSIDTKIDLVSHNGKLGIYQLVVAVAVGILTLILAPRAKDIADIFIDAGTRFYLLMFKVRG